MKILKMILSLLIILFTIFLIYDLVKGLDFDFFDYLDKKYHFIFLTLLAQIFGVYFSSKRWKNCIISYDEGKKILFSFHTYFLLNSRANIINNFLLLCYCIHCVIKYRFSVVESVTILRLYIIEFRVQVFEHFV